MRIPPVTVVLALFAFTLAHPGFAGEQEDFMAWSQSGYSYCDARVLATYWKVDVDQAKARVGRQIKAGAGRKIQAQLDAAHKKLKGKKRVECDFWETTYSYEDAEALAGAWGVDVMDAKTRIARQASLGRTKALDQKLISLGRTPGQDEPADQEGQALEAFWNSGLAYCDAELVGKMWGTDPYNVKVSLGLKILGGDKALLNDELTRARETAASSGALCDFWSTPYSPDDAAALAGFWGVDLTTAKSRIAKTYTLGGAPAVTPQLKAARGAR